MPFGERKSCYNLIANTLALSKTLLVFDAFYDMLNLSEIDPYAKQVVDFWADAEWFTCRLILPEIITVSVFKVSGETNTDDLSPARYTTTRPDIPLHALAMLETRMSGRLSAIAGTSTYSTLSREVGLLN